MRVRAGGRRRGARGRRARAGGRVPDVGGQLRRRRRHARPTCSSSRGRSPPTARSTLSTSASAGTSRGSRPCRRWCPHGAWRPWARAVKGAVGLPVIASNRINTVELADAVLAAGDADFVSMARPFLADPEIVGKALIRTRVGGSTSASPATRRASIGRSSIERVSCVVNPRAGYELELGGGPSPGRSAPGWRSSAADPPAWRRRAPSLPPATRSPCSRPPSGSAVSSGWRAGSRARRTSRGRSPTSRPSWRGWASPVHLETPGARRRRARRVRLRGRRDRRRCPGRSTCRASTCRMSSATPSSSATACWGESVAIIGAGGIGVDVAHLVSHRDVDFYAAYGLEPPGRRGARHRAAGAPRVTLMRRGTRVGEQSARRRAGRSSRSCGWPASRS